VFYEASRDLDSQPPPRIDHVEACRPRGCVCVIDYSCRCPSARRRIDGKAAATLPGNDRRRLTRGPNRKTS
jgi:hypothetical protein